MTLVIGDTPAQLGQIEAADAMIIDGKIVTRDDYRALASQVEALRKQLHIAYDCLTCADETGYVEDCGFVDLESVASDIAMAISRTPQHHLAEIRAEAGRDGFIAGYLLCNDGSPLIKHNYEGFADKYASSIRQEQHSTWLRDSNVNGGRRKGEVE